MRLQPPSLLMVFLAALLLGLPCFAASLGPYETIVSKDLFDPERGAGGDEGGGEALLKSEIEKKFVLYGTMVAGASKVAFLKEASSRAKTIKGRSRSDDIRKVREGERIAGWLVASITGDSVKLVSSGEEVWLRTFESQKSERRADRPVAMETPKVAPVRRTGASGGAVVRGQAGRGRPGTTVGARPGARSVPGARPGLSGRTRKTKPKPPPPLAPTPSNKPPNRSFNPFSGVRTTGGGSAAGTNPFMQILKGGQSGAE